MVKHLILGSGISFLISLTSLIITARLFSLDFIADLKALSLYSGMISSMLTCQVHSSLLYFYRDKDTNKERTADLMFLTTIALALTSILVFYWIFPLFYTSPSLSKKTLLMYSFALPFNMLFIMSSAVYTSKGHSKNLPKFMLGYSSSSLLCLLFAWYCNLTINQYTIVYVITLSIYFSCSLWRAFLFDSLLRIKKLKEVFNIYFYKYSFKMMCSNVLTTIGEKVDKTIATKFFAQGLFAKYSVLSFENPIVNVLLNSFGISLVKKYANESFNQNGFLLEWKENIKFVTFITYPMAAFIILNAEWVITVMFGNRYLDQAIIFKLYSLVSIFRPAPFQALLRMQNLLSYSIFISLIYIISTISLGWVIVVLNKPIHYLPLVFITGWIIFNAFCLITFCLKKKLLFRSIICPQVCFARAIQAFGLAYISHYLLSRNQALNIIFFCFTYLIFSLLFDKHTLIRFLPKKTQS